MYPLCKFIGYRMWCTNFILSQSEKILGLDCNIFEYDTVLKGNNLPIVWREIKSPVWKNSSSIHMWHFWDTRSIYVSFFCRHTMHARLIIILQTFMLVFTTSVFSKKYLMVNGLIQTYFCTKNLLIDLCSIICCPYLYVFLFCLHQSIYTCNKKYLL